MLLRSDEAILCDVWCSEWLLASMVSMINKQHKHETRKQERCSIKSANTEAENSKLLNERATVHHLPSMLKESQAR